MSYLRVYSLVTPRKVVIMDHRKAMINLRLQLHQVGWPCNSEITYTYLVGYGVNES